jgi:hypothetical protein
MPHPPLGLHHHPRRSDHIGPSTSFLPIDPLDRFRKLSVLSTRSWLTIIAIQTFTDEDGAPATLPEMGNGGEESKIRVLLGLLRK